MEKFDQAGKAELVFQIDTFGYMALHYAAEKGDLDSVIILKCKCKEVEDLQKTYKDSHSAKLFTRDSQNFNMGTVIHVAAFAGHAHVV